MNSSSTVSIRFLVSGSGVFDALRSVRVRKGVQRPARSEFLLKCRVLRVVGILRLLLRVEVVERAEELVEAMRRRQVFVEVAEMVLAELAGDVALRLEQLGEGHVLALEALLCARQPDLEEAGAERCLSGDKGGASGGAALLAVVVGEEATFLRQPVDVGRTVAHHALIVGADVPVADVIPPDDEDVRFVRLVLRLEPSS